MSKITFSPNISNEMCNATEALFDWLEDYKNHHKPLPEELRYKVKSGKIDLGARDEIERTPLTKAASYATIETVQYLLDNGADLAVQDKYNGTALHGATLNADITMLEFLLGRGADLNARNSNGETPLFLAARYGRTEITEYLLGQGADPNARNNSGYTPVLAAYQNGTTGVGYSGHIDSAQSLFDHGANLHVRTASWNHAINENPTTAQEHQKTVQPVFDAWISGATDPAELTTQQINQILSVWPLADPYADVPRFEQLDAIFKDARWKDEHAEHKRDLIGQIPGLSSREQMFLMGGHAHALMQKRNDSKGVER